MKAKSFVLAGGVLVGAILLGCGGGGGGVSGTSDFIYYVDNGNSIIRQDFPTGNPFTSGSGTVMSQVRLSPDKSQLLFVNSGQLYVVNTNGTGLTTLTGYKLGDWNSDGSKVFAVSTTNNRIRSMNPDGTAVSADLFDGNAGAGISFLDINDQGTKIGLGYAPSGWTRIHTLNLDGSGLFAVTANNVNSQHPRWSPDGSSFVFNRDNDIYTIDADGTDEGILANSAGAEGMPMFRDSNTILYIVDGDIWQMAPDGTAEVEIYDDVNALGWPESKN